MNINCTWHVPRLLTWSLVLALPLVLVTRTTGQSAPRQASAASGKPRVVITADPELDDVNTLIRALLYSYFGLSGLTADELKSKGYAVWTQPQVKGSFISEGDTPTFMNFINNGLRAHGPGNYGGWGGRRRTEIPGAPGTGRGAGGRGAGIAPRTALVNDAFFAAAQHDFAARLKWSVAPTYTSANHEPVVKIDGPLAVSARSGETVRLRGTVTDPDRHVVTVRWWHYADDSTYPGEIAIPDATALATTLRVPSDAQPGQTIHVILEATDNGTRSLTRYQRVVVTIQTRKLSAGQPTAPEARATASVTI